MKFKIKLSGYGIKIIRILILVMIGTFQMNAQSLTQRLDGVTNFEEIKKIAAQYYQEIKEGKHGLNSLDPNFKNWKRWEYFMQDRLLENGDITTNQLITLREVELLKKQESNILSSTVSDWISLGPNENISNPTSTRYIGLGRVDRIAFHPTNPNIIFIGTPAGGLWKTTDGGNNWNPVDEFLPSMGISGIVISQTNPNLMYVLTGSGDGGGVWSSSGVLKSIDGGTTWSLTGNLSSTFFAGYALVIDPNNDQILFAATTEGLYWTYTGGNTWIKVRSGTIFDVKFKPGSSTTIYACSSTAMFYSTLNGSFGSWLTSSLSPAIDTGRKAIAVTAADPERVFLNSGPGNFAANTFIGFYYSANSGRDFIRVATSPDIAGSQSGYDFCLTASPTQQNVVIAGGLTCWRSTNSGNSWSGITTFGSNSELPGYVHPDIHAVEFNPLNGYLYAGTDGGFYRSQEADTTWTNLSKGLRITQFYHMTGTPVNFDLVLAGCQDNGLKLRKTNSTSFDHIEGTDGFSSVFFPGDPSKFYSSYNDGNIKKHTNYGTAFNDVQPPGQQYSFMELATHQTNGSIVFAGANDDGGKFYKSIDEGVTWATVSLPAGDAIITCPSNHNRLYFAGSKKVFKSDNLGTTIDSIHQNTGFPSSYSSITDLAVSPSNSQVIYVTFGGFTSGTKIAFSVNGGSSWTNISGSLPNVPANCVAVTAGGDIYVGTDIGVFYKGVGISEWIPYRNGMPKVIVTDLYIHPVEGKIRASTFGRGIWESTLSNGTCETQLVWSTVTTMSGYKYYEASQTITNKSIITGGMTTSVFFKAGNYIDLQDGFHAKADGLIFNASIGPCAGGGIPALKKIEEVKKE